MWVENAWVVDGHINPGKRGGWEHRRHERARNPGKTWRIAATFGYCA